MMHPARSGAVSVRQSLPSKPEKLGLIIINLLVPLKFLYFISDIYIYQ